MDHMIPSIRGHGWFGILFPRMAALPRWSRMLILLHRWEVASPSSWPVWRARAAPSFFTSLLASGCHPPKVSATIGKKAISGRTGIGGGANPGLGQRQNLLWKQLLWAAWTHQKTSCVEEGVELPAIVVCNIQVLFERIWCEVQYLT